MAKGDPNAAYQTLQMFNRNPPTVAQAPAGGVVTAGYQAQTQSAPVNATGPSTAALLAQFAQNAGALVNQVQTYRTTEADEKVNDFMRRHTVEEYRDIMAKGQVPFQSDTLAMSVLHNKAGYYQALQIEQQFQQRVEQGEFRTIEDMDKARVEALEKGRSEYVLQNGISPDDKAFTAGWDRDFDRRRDVMMAQQTAVTDKLMRTSADIINKADMVAPLPDITAQMGAKKAAEYIVTTANNAWNLGTVRTPGEQLGLVSHAMESLAAQQGGYEVLRELGDQTVSINGKASKVRDLMGGAKYDLAVAQAQQAQFKRDGERFTKLHTDIQEMVSARDDAGIESMIQQKLKESAGMMTPEIQALQHAKDQVRHKQEVEAKAAQEELAKQMEKDGRLRGAQQTLLGILSGALDGAGVSTKSEDMGLKDRAERTEAEQRVLEGYPQGPKRDAAILKMASFIPDGYAGNALKGQATRAKADWDVLQGQITSGNIPKDVPESVKRVIGLAQSMDGQGEGLLLSAIGETPSFMTAVRSGQAVGMDPIQVAVAQANYKKLPEKERTDFDIRVKQATLDLKLPDTALNGGAVRDLAMNYVQLGVAPKNAVQMAERDYRDQNVIYRDRSAIHKSWFTMGQGPEYQKAGQATFDHMAEELMKAAKISDSEMHFRYHPDSKTVDVIDLKNGRTLSTIRQEDVRARYNTQIEKQRAERQGKIDSALVDASAVREKRVQSKQAESEYLGIPTK